jgi:hypothetical protein
MDSENVDPKSLESRPPTVEDLVKLCRDLNSAGVHYIVIGGLAVIAQGLTRGTEDIDLLIQDNIENHKKLLGVLNQLPDGASEELTPQDLSQFEVVRVADEFVIDLMTKACGESYDGNEKMLEPKVIDGVQIPFASAELLLKLKQGVREKDKIDRSFLERKLGIRKS